MEQNTPTREKLGSRLGFILISAGCAIGLGNVWRFPYIVGQYGGAAFILLYLVFLVIFGLPIMTMEFSVGRGGKAGIVGAFRNTEPKGTKWHIFGYFGVAGNYLLMMFYTVITGWMLAYFFKTITGDFEGLDAEGVGAAFGEFTGDPFLLILFTLLAVGLGFLICSLGLEKGVEKITKVMMVALLVIISVLAIHAVTLPGAGEGLKFYLVPDFGNLFGGSVKHFGEVVFAALGQAFFTLSLGMGSMAIFGSYIGKERSLFGESLTIAGLDTFVAFVAGLIIFPSCSAYGVSPNAGPGLIFVTLPNVFNHMPGGRIWGALFFLFMIFAAMSTLVAVFENILAFAMDELHWSRRKACVVNFFLICVLTLPCIFGFNLLSGFQPLGEGTMVLDLEDFLVSNNILPLGSLVYVLFCTVNKKYAWGYDNFLAEERGEKGLSFPKPLRIYVSYVLPAILLILWAQGYISMFFS